MGSNILISLLLLYTTATSAKPSVQAHHEDPRTRIVGGDEAAPHSAPFMVFLQMHKTSNNGWSRCGGSVLSNQYVLTAAHCLRGKYEGRVYFGAHSVSESQKTGRQLQEVDASTFTIHPSIDIGIIKVPEPVDVSGRINISTVTLPTRADKNKSYSQKHGTIYGWGLYSDTVRTLPDKLRYANVTVSSVCTSSTNEICTLGTNGVGTCGGDSGGPLIVDGVQIGVTSWGPEACEAGDVSVYVSVNKVIDWIESVMKS